MLRKLLDRLSRRAAELDPPGAEQDDKLDEIASLLDVADLAGAKAALTRLEVGTAARHRVEILQARSALLEQRFAEADEMLDKVLLYRPREVDALAWRAAAQMSLQRPEEALKLAEQAIRLGYRRAWLFEMAGVVHYAAQRYSEASDCWATALSMEPERSASRRNLIEALAMQRRWAELEPHLRQAIAEEGETARWLTYLGNSLIELGHENDAWEAFGKAAARNDADATDLRNYAVALFYAAQLDPAKQALQRAMSLDPNEPLFPVMRANIDLIERGPSRDAWQAYERRADIVPGFFRVRSRRWQGEPMGNGKTLLVYGEQGIGDVLLFSRWLPAIARQARGSVVFGVVPSLHRLFLQTAARRPEWAGISIVGQTRPENLSYEAELPLLSVPLTIDVAVERLSGGYLATDPQLDREWAEQLPQSGRKRVGLVWAGNPARLDDAIRSIPTRCLSALADDALLQKIEFVSLQMDARAEHKSVLLPLPHLDPTPHIKDFADTASIVKQLDLVVSIDTAMAHLAGAMGTPCVVVLSRLPDWRWSMGGIDQPWFGGHRSVRAERNRDWTDALDTLRTQLLAWADQPAAQRTAD